MDNDLDSGEIIEKELSLFMRVKGIFINTEDTIKDIIREPNILMPAFLLMIIFAVTYIMQFSIIKEEIINQFKVLQMSNPSIEITDILVNRTLYSGLVAGAFLFAITPMVKGLLVYGISLLNSGKGKLKQTVSMFVYSYFIVALGQIILAILKNITGNIYITLSPAMFFKSLEANGLMNAFLSYFDVFTILYLVVTIIGIKIVHELSALKATIVVLIPSVIYLLLIIVPTLANLG
jgi:hypothetical protein